MGTLSARPRLDRDSTEPARARTDRAPVLPWPATAKTSALALLTALCACGDPASDGPLPTPRETCSERPPATRRDELVEELHGTPVAVPYRWLEDVAHPGPRRGDAALARTGCRRAA